MMNDGTGAGARYKSTFDCLQRTVRVEGATALFRGWWPAYCRLGPHALICFPVFEQFRSLVGVEAL